jgi:carbon monoxide dehydrogenase subunit G
VRVTNFQAVAQRKLDCGIITPAEFDAVVTAHRAAFAAVATELRFHGLADAASSASVLAAAAVVPSTGVACARVVASGRALGDGTVVLRHVTAGYLYRLTGTTVSAASQNQSKSAKTTTARAKKKGGSSGPIGTDGGPIVRTLRPMHPEQPTLRGAPLGFSGALFLLEVSEPPAAASSDGSGGGGSDSRGTGAADLPDAPPGSRLLWARCTASALFVFKLRMKALATHAAHT